MIPQEIYHVYNRGNNKQLIFFEKENYYYFLKKVKIFLSPYCHILAYTLMPNHFHFLVSPNDRTNLPYRSSNRYSHHHSRRNKIPLTMFSWGLQHLLSSYARGINTKYHRTGSLFQQNTKTRKTSSDSLADDYSLWCFIYIHNNPKVAGIVNSPDEYEFSSFRDYLGNKSDSICNVSLAKKLLCLEQNELFRFQNLEVPGEIVNKIIK